MAHISLFASAAIVIGLKRIETLQWGHTKDQKLLELVGNFLIMQNNLFN